MSNIMNIGVRALIANQAALQVVGNNIANVNTPGYSRQSVILQNVPGQFSGSGYYGKGVDVLTIQRNYSDFLTKQATASKSTAAADSTRYDSLRQLENIFQGGPDGLGASVSNMLNAFSDIVSAPTDMTARSMVLTRAEETANTFQAAANQLNDLKVGVTAQLQTDVDSINSLANQIARANDEIARATGSGQAPNDLLDQRDQFITQLNKFVQTSSVKADDGSISLFLAGSQPLVLGTTVSPVTIDPNKLNAGFSDPATTKLGITVGGVTNVIDESMLGGGEVAGLLRFKNRDLADASNLLGRMALAIGTKMNEQQGLGLDLNGIQGMAMFKLSPIPNGYASKDNPSFPGGPSLTVGVQTNPSGTTSFIASDYEFAFTSATAGNITRLSDGTVTAFDFGITNPVKIDGLDITKDAVAAAAGDRFLIKPFSTAASSITTAFSSPMGLAVASPVTAAASALNTGNLTVAGLAARSMPAPAAVTLTFTGPGTYTRSDTGAIPYSYTPGQPIEYSTAPPLIGWSLTLKGTPNVGDTIQVMPTPPAYVKQDAGNAQAMLGLRDLAMFDGAPLTDGYASLMSEIGIKVMSAKSAAAASTNIATNIEKDRAGISGVNLDEEAAKLLQYQQAYQASGKMLQIAQNLFDTLIQSLGH